jgi:putative protease
MVLEYNKDTKVAKIEERNRIMVNDEVEILNPDGTVFLQKIKEMKDCDMQNIDVAPHPRMIVYMPMDKEVCKYSMIRKKVVE